VQPRARIGRYASLRAGAMVGHDAVLEDHAYVGPNATLCGRSRLRLGAHLGPNAVILDSKCVGAYAVVGIGAAVTKDVRDYAVVMGNPARRVGVVSRDRDV
jgi:acetyltransferase-like isoleucine patch superfamily enzyme